MTRKGKTTRSVLAHDWVDWENLRKEPIGEGENANFTWENPRLNFRPLGQVVGEEGLAIHPVHVASGAAFRLSNTTQKRMKVKITGSRYVGSLGFFGS